jgi:acyl-CoA thioester hydrolase
MSISSDFKCIVKWPVQWGDQDSYGHVNNTIYLRWFESGRIDYLTRIGFDEWMTKYKIGPILAAVNCNFRQQLKFPDSVTIGSRITHIGRTSTRMSHVIHSDNKPGIIAEGDSVVVWFDYNSQKPIPVPDEIRQAIEKIEGKSFSSS